MTPDNALQELYGYAIRGWGHDSERVRLLVQAAGVAYERDGVSLIDDSEYDRLGMWLGDSAATAMDWHTYPPEALKLATTMGEAARQRRGMRCFECWAPDCACPETPEIGAIVATRESECSACDHTLQAHCATTRGEPVFTECECGCRCFAP